MISCCEFHSKTECGQGDHCPAGKTPAAHYCAKSRQPCATPYTCSARCRLITANSHGSDPQAKPAQVPRASVLRWCAVLIAFGALAALCVRQAERFIN